MLKNLQASVATDQAAIRELEKQHEALDGKKKQVAAGLQQFFEQKTEYTRLVEWHRAVTVESGGLVRQRDQITAQLADLAGKEQEYRELEREVPGCEEKKRTLEELRRRKAEFERLSAEQRFAGQECAALTARVEKEKAKIAALDRDKERLASLLAGIRSLFGIGPGVPDTGLEHAIRARESEVLGTIGTLSARREQLVSERNKVLANWNKIQDAGEDGVCPLCRQTLGSHFGRIEEEFTSRLECIEQEGLQVFEDQEAVTAEKERIIHQKPALDEIRGISERLKTRPVLEDDLRELLAQLQAKEDAMQSVGLRIRETGYDEAVYTKTEREVAGLEKVQKRFIELGKQIAHGTALKAQVADLGRQVTEKQGELVHLKAMIDQSAFDPEAGARLEQLRAETDSAIGTVGTGIARTSERLRHTGEKIAQYERDEEKIAGLKRKVGTLKEEIDLLRLTRTVIGEYVLYLMQVVRSRIEGEVSRIIGEITGGRYEQVLLDGDFNLLVRDIDNDYPIDRFSGGEQDDIAVALRIALSRYLAELHRVHESTLLIFDEIFGSQDEERRTNLLTALRTQESRFPQIVLISHIPEMQGEFTNTLMVEIGSDLASRVKEVA